MATRRRLTPGYGAAGYGSDAGLSLSGQPLPSNAGQFIDPGGLGLPNTTIFDPGDEGDDVLIPRDDAIRRLNEWAKQTYGRYGTADEWNKLSTYFPANQDGFTDTDYKRAQDIVRGWAGTPSTTPPPPTPPPTTPPPPPPTPRRTPGGDIPPDPGIYTGPSQGVGGDPLSQDITASMRDLMQNFGTTPFGGDVNETLRSLIQRGGELPDDMRTSRLVRARDTMERGRRVMQNNLRDSLASRGLLSEPGIPQGIEASSMRRFDESIAGPFAEALRDVELAENDAANTRLLSSLQLATGASTEQARTMLASAGAGTDRQAMLSNVALQSLAQNQSWNRFLAEFGLERQQVLEQMQNGNIAQLLPLLNLFVQLTSLSRGGFI